LARDVRERTAWIGGATGRLGDALVEQVVARCYARVCVLGPHPMPTTVRGFESVDLETLKAVPGSRPCDDVYLLYDPRPLPPGVRPAFDPLPTPAAVVAVAETAAAAGAMRLVLLAPLAAWQQLSAATRLLPQGLEAALAATSIATVIVMKPTREAAIRSLGGPRLRRFARFYLSQLRFMLPSSSQVIRSVDLARIAVEQLTTADAPGVRVIGLAAIEAAIAARRTAAVGRSERR
jgi:hypothetical protein